MDTAFMAMLCDSGGPVIAATLKGNNGRVPKGPVEESLHLDLEAPSASRSMKPMISTGIPACSCRIPYLYIFICLFI